MATKQNLKDLQSGDTWDFEFEFKDSDGNSIDVTDYDLQFTLRDKLIDTVEVDDSSAIIAVDKAVHDQPDDDPGNGFVTFRVPYTKTQVCNKSFYYYDFQVLIDAVPFTLFYGTISIVKDRTTRTTV